MNFLSKMVKGTTDRTDTEKALKQLREQREALKVVVKQITERAGAHNTEMKSQ